MQKAPSVNTMQKCQWLICTEAHLKTGKVENWSDIGAFLSMVPWWGEGLRVWCSAAAGLAGQIFHSLKCGRCEDVTPHTVRTYHHSEQTLGCQRSALTSCTMTSEKDRPSWRPQLLDGREAGSQHTKTASCSNMNSWSSREALFPRCPIRNWVL